MFLLVLLLLFALIPPAPVQAAGWYLVYDHFRVNETWCFLPVTTYVTLDRHNEDFGHSIMYQVRVDVDWGKQHDYPPDESGMWVRFWGDGAWSYETIEFYTMYPQTYRFETGVTPFDETFRWRGIVVTTYQKIKEGVGCLHFDTVRIRVWGYR